MTRNGLLLGSQGYVCGHSVGFCITSGTQGQEKEGKHNSAFEVCFCEYIPSLLIPHPSSKHRYTCSLYLQKTNTIYNFSEFLPLSF